MAQLKENISKDRLRDEIRAIKETSNVLKVEDRLHDKIHRLSKRYLHGHGFFFIGRDIFYPLALEGALKLKEISYLHAEGYPAGVLTPGPIWHLLIVNSLTNSHLWPKTIPYIVSGFTRFPIGTQGAFS